MGILIEKSFAMGATFIMSIGMIIGGVITFYNEGFSNECLWILMFGGFGVIISSIYFTRTKRWQDVLFGTIALLVLLIIFLIIGYFSK